MHHGRDTVVVVLDATSARRLCEFLLEADTAYKDIADLKTALAVQLDGAVTKGAEWERKQIAEKYSP